MSAPAAAAVASIPETEARSAPSLAFEALWRSLAGARAMPNRADFTPAKAAQFLPDLVLFEVRLAALPRFRIRLAGTAVEAQIQSKLVDRDYLDFVPEVLRQGVEESAQLMLQHPCGLWQLMPVHYARGFAQCLEVTMFPLASDSVPQFVALVKFLEQVVSPIKVSGAAMLVQTATQFHYIDCGHGVPA